jgi:prepilin-type N-terminal cleavage/methylation domain-containing protein
MIRFRKDSRQFGGMRWYNARGYTLVELFVVIMVLGIITAMSAGAVIRSKVQARETAALGTLSMMTTGYEEYRFRYNEYPRWGPDQPFEDPRELIDFMISEGFLPRAFRNYEYFPEYNFFKGFAEDYYLQILPHNFNEPDVPPARGSYYIILAPGNYQRRFLSAIYDPYNGAVTVKARKAISGEVVPDDLESYRLFTFAD